MTDMIVKKGHPYFLEKKRLHDVFILEKDTPNPMVWHLWDREDHIGVFDAKYDALAVIAKE